MRATNNLLLCYLIHCGLAGAEWLMLSKSIMQDMANRNEERVKYYRDIRIYELGLHSWVNKNLAVTLQNSKGTGQQNA